jgi:LacI family transcriptional regulator, repressor for deo operon, udp, cdd, tsx, nupC, and nupG
VVRPCVPGDVALVSFDDTAVASSTDPPLTTMRQPLDVMARALIEVLLNQIAGGGGEGERIICPAELIRRRSA